jgi:hypothetical protein
MKDSENQISTLQDLPNCQKLFEEIKKDFDYLFDVHDAHLVYGNDYESFGGCELVIAVKGMKIWFEIDRGGKDIRVAPSTTKPPSESNDWQPILIVLDFVENRAPAYFGPDVIDSRIATRTATRKSFEKLVHFYSGNEYSERKDEFLAWLANYKVEFMQQVQEYYAAGR